MEVKRDVISNSLRVVIYNWIVGSNSQGRVSKFSFEMFIDFNYAKQERNVALVKQEKNDGYLFNYSLPCLQ